jgi:hypothetical protein
MAYAAVRRINDLSTYFVLASLISLIFLPTALLDLAEWEGTFTLKTYNLKLLPQMLWLAWLVLSSSAYLYVVYRDGGTFFYPWSAGIETTLPAQALSGTNQSEVTNLHPRSNRVFIIPTESSGIAPKTTNTPWLMGLPIPTSVPPTPIITKQKHCIQVLEGMFILAINAVGSLWIVLGCTFVRTNPKPTIKDSRHRALAHAYKHVVGACLLPIGTFITLFLLGLKIALYEGIQNVPGTVVGAAIMLLSYCTLFAYSMIKAGSVLIPSWKSVAELHPSVK